MFGDGFIYSSGRAVSPVVKFFFRETFLAPVGFVLLEKRASGMPFDLASDAQEKRRSVALSMLLMAATVATKASGFQEKPQSAV
jgi:hypothetical protein